MSYLFAVETWLYSLRASCAIKLSAIGCNSFFQRKMLGARYGPVETRFSLIPGTCIGSLKHRKKNPGL